QEGQVRCPQCKNMCLVSWRKGEEGRDHDRKFEDRLKVDVLQGSEAARIGKERPAPGPAKSARSSGPVSKGYSPGPPPPAATAAPATSGRKDAARPASAKPEKGKSSASPPEPAPPPVEPKVLRPR